MKNLNLNNNKNPLNSVHKLFVPPLHLLHVLSYFLLFALCLSFGILLTFHFTNLKFNLKVSQFSLSTSPPSSPQPPPAFQFSPSTSPPSSLGRPQPPPALAPPCSETKNSSTEDMDDEAKKILEAPNVVGDMSDEELLSRASMAPRIGEFPYDGVQKVAFLFLTRQSVVLAPLWERFFKGNKGLYSIYVHSNPSFNETEHEGSVFHGRRIPSKEVEWGNVNMIEAERRLLANALLDLSNQRFVLLSESCIPLFNFSTIYTYLTNSTQSFVQVFDQRGPVGRGRYNKHMSPDITIQQWRKGSQWFEMDRDLALQVVLDRIYFPIFQKYCKGSCYADEHYLPTFVYMKFGEKNSNRSVTWVDWSKPGPHPGKFLRPYVTEKLLENLRSGSECKYNGKRSNVCFLFARKFMPNTLERLLRFAPKVMHY